jgi:hypothetical protein
MARDPAMPLTDVQWVLGHAHLSTTQLYLTAPVEDVIATVVAHHARRQERPPDGQDRAGAAARYRPEVVPHPRPASHGQAAQQGERRAGKRPPHD